MMGGKKVVEEGPAERKASQVGVERSISILISAINRISASEWEGQQQHGLCPLLFPRHIHQESRDQLARLIEICKRPGMRVKVRRHRGLFFRGPQLFASHQQASSWPHTSAGPSRVSSMKGSFERKSLFNKDKVDDADGRNNFVP
jgi:hypothetical protein